MFKKLIAGVAIASVLGLTGCTQSEAMQNTEACADLASQLNSLGSAFEYIKADINSQNLTGSYDFEGMKRQLATVRLMSQDFTRIEGTEKFNTARDSFVSALNAYISGTELILNGGSIDASAKAESDIQRTAIAFSDICPSV